MYRLTAFIIFHILLFADLQSYCYSCNVVESADNGNTIVLFNDLPISQQLIKNNVTYIINSNFNLNGEQIKLPNKSTLKFVGGKFFNGSLVGNESSIIADNVAIFDHVVITGSWSVSTIYDTWFVYDSAQDNPANDIINNIFSLTDDTVYNTVHFEENRIYWYEVSYKGVPSLGDKVRPVYAKLNSEEFSKLIIFRIKSNTKIIINNIWKMIPTNQGAYTVFSISEKENIEICGNGAIYGDARSHIYTDPFVSGSNYYGEFGFIFRVLSCRNIIIRDITIAESFGDGLVIGAKVLKIESGTIPSSPSEGTVLDPTQNLLVDNIKVLFNRRNGISCCGHNIFIRNVYFEGNGIEAINGTAPMCAVDFESDYIKINPKCRNESVYLSSCVFRNNRYDVSSTNNTIEDLGEYATVISDCIFSAPLRLNTTYWIKFINCHIPYISNVGNSINYFTYSRHLAYVNCSFDELNPYIVTAASKYQQKFINCTSPHDTDGMKKFFVNLSSGQSCKLAIPKGAFSKIELIAFANCNGRIQSVNKSTYTLGNFANTAIDDIQVDYCHDSILTTSIYKNLPIFSNVEYNGESNSYEIYLAMGNTIQNEHSKDNWRIVIYYSLKSAYSILKHGEVTEAGKGYLAISGGVYPETIKINNLILPFDEIRGKITFPYAEVFNAVKKSELPILEASNIGRMFFLTDDKIPVWYDPYTKQYRMANGFVLDKIVGSSSERPQNVEKGFQYFDTTLNKPLWSKGDNVWVDAIGTIVE